MRSSNRKSFSRVRSPVRPSFTGKRPTSQTRRCWRASKIAYHDSLAVSPAELRRQYRREVDLAKILEKLYARYCDLVATERRLTARDAVALAVGTLRADASRSERLRAAHRFAFVDDAGEATSGEIQLLREIFGADLGGVTLCDAPASAERGAHFALQQQHRSPIAIEIACRRLIGGESVRAENVEPRLFVHRAASRSAEAAFVARARARMARRRNAPGANRRVLFRSIRHVEVYESALLDRDVNVVTGGDANVFADRRALDALALLWNVVDPFRHDWMLRTLGNPALGLSDASLALLCAETPNPQTPLFVFDDDPAPTARSTRWDPKRDLRLGWNVVRGEQDGALSSAARERLQRFRTLRAGWVNALSELAFEEFARLVWHEGLAREGSAGSARAAAQQFVLKRLLARLAAFSRERGGATADEILEYAQRRAASDLEACEDDDGAEGVRLLSVEAARGREFDRVAIADVRAGAFPRWYSPDAFLYSPRLGMIPKENAGDARASRTAKFSYYTHRNKTREHYNQRERALFAYGLRRARLRARDGIAAADEGCRRAGVSRGAAARAPAGNAMAGITLRRLEAAEYVRDVLPQTAALWAGRRDFRTYVAQTLEIAESGYGRRYYRTFALFDGERMVASFKRYDRFARNGSERLRACGIGAVFTPEEYRGRGYASVMLAAALDAARAVGYDAAFLYSDIAPAFYVPLAFVALPSREIALRADALPARRLEPDVLSERDWPGVRRCYESGEGQRMAAFARAPSTWAYLRLRLGLEAATDGGRQTDLVLRRERSGGRCVRVGRALAPRRRDAYAVDEFGSGCVRTGRPHCDDSAAASGRRRRSAAHHRMAACPPERARGCCLPAPCASGGALLIFTLAAPLPRARKTSLVASDFADAGRALTFVLAPPETTCERLANMHQCQGCVAVRVTRRAATARRTSPFAAAHLRRSTRRAFRAGAPAHPRAAPAASRRLPREKSRASRVGSARCVWRPTSVKSASFTLIPTVRAPAFSRSSFSANSSD